MFDLNVVARNIRNARMSKNMTQMNLADEVGVSYQAVSNWERGNSMPDIGKMTSLCTILDVSFEELVGEKSRAVENVQKVMQNEEVKIPLEEIIEIAPIMNPKQIEDMTNLDVDDDNQIDIGTLCGLAPFLSREALEKISDQVVEVDAGALCGIAPFLSKETLGKLADRVVDEGLDIGVLCGIAAFLPQEKLSMLAERIKMTDIGALCGIAPFLPKETLGKLADKVVDEDLDFGALCGIAPFLPKEKLDMLAERVEMMDVGALMGLAPFLSSETLDKISQRKLMK